MAESFSKAERIAKTMAKFLVEIWLDGYDTEEETKKACAEFIYEQLNMTASSVKITPVDDKDEE